MRKDSVVTVTSACPRLENSLASKLLGLFQGPSVLYQGSRRWRVRSRLRLIRPAAPFRRFLIRRGLDEFLVIRNVQNAQAIFVYKEAVVKVGLFLLRSSRRSNGWIGEKAGTKLERRSLRCLFSVRLLAIALNSRRRVRQLEIDGFGEKPIKTKVR